MIRILDKQTADKIAAGEVIERPVSIVKELVENSIDAGATSIVIEIEKGGKSYIRVTDNGIGIPAEDTEKAFLRHATSKIRQAADLDAIETLGFRGEALASICAVTRTELLTKTKNEKTGTRLIIHGGQIISDNRTGCPDGTTFIVTDLFYNTPARLKFMKNDGAESSMIIDLISQMALAYSHISFRTDQQRKHPVFYHRGRKPAQHHSQDISQHKHQRYDTGGHEGGKYVPERLYFNSGHVPGPAAAVRYYSS